MKKDTRKVLKKVWHFIWEDNSVWSWIVNVILAFVLIKFIVYPGLGFVLATTHPIVAVVSESMEHHGMGFDDWWKANGAWYESNGITKSQFSEFLLKNGFNKGDIMILRGKEPDNIRPGDVIVFRDSRPDPIIHRVVKKWAGKEGMFFETKGDNNQAPIKGPLLDETNIHENQIIGTAIIRVPLLGYVKIWFVEMLRFAGVIQ